MSYRFLGPSQTLRLKEDGPVYRQGEVVPISKELAERMSTQAFGALRFEGIEVKPEIVRVLDSLLLVNDQSGVPHVVEPREAEPAVVADAKAPVAGTAPAEPAVKK